MNFKNLIIYDNDEVLLQNTIKDRIKEIEKLIDTLYTKYNKEIAVEYNFGSIMQQYEISLVIYNNPERNNNPYIFMYIDTEEYHILLDRADIALFKSFIDNERFLKFNFYPPQNRYFHFYLFWQRFLM